MTLRDVLKVLGRRWPVIAACILVAASVTFALTPATPAKAEAATSYTATATLVVGSTTPDTQVNMGRIRLYLTTGEVPRLAAEKLGYTGDPASLAGRLTVEPDFQAMSLPVSVTSSRGEEAAQIANAFADVAVEYFKTNPSGATNIDLSILQRATPVADPVKAAGFVIPPGRIPRAGLAAAVGLLLGLALAFAIDRIDSRLRTTRDLEAALGLPIIGDVPKLGRISAKTGIGLVNEPLSPYADAYRAARTAIAHRARSAAGDRGDNAAAPVILVTSAHAGEGKSTSIANLAASFAETGQRVLVLDADLRSPALHTHFDVPQGAGISDYLNDSMSYSVETLSRPTSLPDVRILTAGTNLNNPASLASRMGGLMAEAREFADVVLVDAAPILAASDVFDLLGVVDMVVLVVRSGRLEEPEARRLSELLRRFQVAIGGAIVVGAKSVRGRKGGYGRGYGRGYGQTSNKRPDPQPKAEVASESVPTRSSRSRR